MAEAIFEVNIDLFLSKTLKWSKDFKQVCLLNSNGFENKYSSVSRILAVGAKDVFESMEGGATFEKIEKFKSRYPSSWIPGFLSYDLKNEIENISSQHPNHIGFPEAYFFIPEIIIEFRAHSITVHAEDPNEVFREIMSTEDLDPVYHYQGKIQNRMGKSEYINVFENIKRHIIRGDIYEANLCQEFFDPNAKIENPESLYLKLNEVSPTPFSCFFKFNDNFIISASPERFLAKRDNTLISQPIKGTAARGKNIDEDLKIKDKLISDPKEIAENVMIVDLVRNDLTRSAISGTVKVTEKLGLYSFKHVHQLISTITCEKNPVLSDTLAIKNTFPAGSMTGAPKISAMLLCDKYEYSRRGIYSGAIGYFAPNGDFDFNVVIRTILYNSSTNYLSFHTGGAITIDAVAENEYAECLTKASAIISALSHSF